MRHVETWLAKTFREPHAVAAAVAEAGIPERTLKRRFKAATGGTLIDHVQNLPVEEANHLLETERLPADEVAAAVGYETRRSSAGCSSGRRASPSRSTRSTGGCSSR